MSDDKSFFGFAKTAFGWVSAAVSFIAGIVSFIKLVSGDTRLVFYVVLVVAFIFLWGSCFYLYFLKKKERMHAGVTSQVPSEKPVLPKRVREIAWWGMFVVPSLALLSLAIQLYHARKPSDKIIVTVANFQSLDSSISGTTERILAKLGEATKPYKSDIKIDPLQRPITEQEGGSDAAQSIGRARKATIVIWGWDDKSSIHAYFEVLLNSQNYLSVLGSNQAMDLIVAGHETLKVQMSLTEDLAYFTLLAVGLARYDLQDYNGAVKLLNDALSHANAQSLDSADNKQAKIAIGYFYLARALTDQGDYNQAKANLQEALKYKSDYEAAHLHLGYVYHLLGDDESAKQEFDQAINLYTAVIAKNPKNVDAYNNRGSAYMDRRDPERALQDYNQVIQLEPSNARAFNNRGLIFYQEGKIDRAFEDFNRAVGLAPKDPSLYNNRGAAYSSLGKYKEALDDYAKVVKYRPNNSLSYLSRAFVYFDKRDYNSAISDYNKAIELGPNNSRAYRNRAWAHFFSGHYTDAARDSEKFLHLQQPCNNNKDFMYMAILAYLSLRKASQPGPAAALLDRAVNECGPSKWQYSLLRFLHHDINAQQLLAEAGDKDSLTEAYTYIGMDFLFAGQHEEAARNLQWVKDNGNREFDEYHVALAEIDRLRSASGN